jgi:VanZ family protein
MTLALGIIFAASDEIHQLFVPGRFCSVADFLFDCIGLAILAAVAAKIHPAPPAGETRNTMNSIPSPGGKR